MSNHQYFVYIMTNQYNSVLYTGMTNNLVRRVIEHKRGEVDGFSKKYKTTKLVYFEQTDYVLGAIEREKQIKGWKRFKKIELIESVNSDWNDLSHAFT